MLNYTLMSIQASELCKQATDAAGVLATRRLQFSDNSDRPRGFCDVNHRDVYRHLSPDVTLSVCRTTRCGVDVDQSRRSPKLTSISRRRRPPLMTTVP